MKLSEKEKAARKAAFRAMGPGEKLGYIWDYYKWPILLGLVLLLVLGSVLHRNLTKKEPVVYLALANVALGEDLQRELTEGYLLHAGLDGRRQEVYLYLDLYLSDDPELLLRLQELYTPPPATFGEAAAVIDALSRETDYLDTAVELMRRFAAPIRKAKLLR